MTPHEIAHQLDQMAYDCTIEEWNASPMGQATNLIRQQAQEIELLKEQLALLKGQK